MKLIKSTFVAALFFFTYSVYGATVTTIRSGNAWYATDGTVINAHGGGMYYEKGYYYWFGEYRTGMLSDGISVYRSKDLLSWENLGKALAPTGEKTNTLQDIAQGRTLERPKVIYNQKTGKYVMWCHWEDGNDYSKARVAVATADKVEGPYTFLRTFRPNGEMSRDQTVFVDGCKAYQLRSSEDNQTMQCSELSENYCKPSSEWNRVIINKQYEAPAIMKIGGVYFGMFSECTGWNPNSAHICMTTDVMSNDWSELGNPCIDNNASTTYQSQSTFFLKVEGYDNAYMYMGDRWYSSNVQNSTYVWLPVHLRTGYPIINWYDNWKPSIFENMYRFKRAKEIESGKTYALLSRLSDRLVSDNGSICLYDDDDNTNLQFVFEKNETFASYALREVESGKYLTAAGTTVILSNKSTAESQQWIFDKQGDKFYVVKNKQTGTCLTVKDGSTSNGAQLVLGSVMSEKKTKFGVYFDTKQFDYPIDDFFTDSTTTAIEAVHTDKSACELKVDGDRFTMIHVPIGNNVVKMFDMAGGVFFEKKFETSYGNQNIVFTCPSNNMKGIYILSVHNNETGISKNFKLYK